jgi:Ni/Fe-hydrogenase subunit HybB-like protein
MLEKALRGNASYWAGLALLAGMVLVGAGAYARQFEVGLGVTGLSRDVPWGFYIAQFTFLVGVGASAVMLVLPYYLHHFRAFGRIVILGEFLSIAAVLTCLLFVLVDMGQPLRSLNVILYPTPRSPMFWDVLSLSGYLLLNTIIGFGTLGAERKGVAPAAWLRPLIWLSIPWAVSIHTVTAFIYAGLEARTFWRTAILAPRFLASAFASGPSLLILLCLLLRRTGRLDAGDEALQRLRQIVAYALVLSAFFFGVELFTVLYANIPEELSHLRYLFLGLDGKTALRGWMWASQALVLLALVVILLPATRYSGALLALGCAAAVGGIWIDKGMGTVVAGFIPNCFDQVSEYQPTMPELAITLGVYGFGALIFTILCKIAVGVRHELDN